MKNFLACFGLLVFLYQADANAARTLLEGQSDKTHYVLEEVYSGLGIPWGLAFLSENQVLISEREGTLFLLNLDDKNLIQISGSPKVLAEGQGGLLDVAIHPAYPERVYLSYSKEVNNQGTTALGFGILENNKRLTNWQDIFVAKLDSNTSRHYGSRIAFDNKGHVFLSIGDRGNREDAQSLTNHAGTIVRLKLSGHIPKDNPFLSQKNALPEIWSYGHRNPQGLAFTSDKSQLWSIEHGPRGGDEINLIKPGKNYGWPIISYGKEYWGPFSVGEGTHKEGMEQPVKHYIPSIAPGSLLVYSGKLFRDWQGNLFSGALRLTHLNQVTVDKSNQAVKETRLLESLNERIRSVTESPKGMIYLSTDSGRILRLRDKK